jgi:hypothetical protein
MAAIAPPDPYACLIRKIGWSVGLESIVERVEALTRLYIRDGKLSPATWRALIATFGRRVDADRMRRGKKSAADHIADFYSSLSLVLPVRAEIHPQWALDVLAILLRRHNTQESSQRALKAFLLQRLVEADGDIFLNLLDVQFDPTSAAHRLEQMVIRKREAIQRVLRNPAVLRKVFSIIDIRDLPGSQNNESRGARPRPSVFQHGVPNASEVSVTQKYLNKVLPTRKGWARDLGLFDKGLTPVGTDVLKHFRQVLQIADPQQAITVWPLESDLLRLRLPPSDLQTPALKSWDFVAAIARGYCGVEIPEYTDAGRDDLAKLLADLFSVYRTTNTDRAVLKNQLPIYVAEPAAVFSLGLAQGRVHNVDSFIRSETRRQDRRFEFMNIRGTEGGIAFRKV